MKGNASSFDQTQGDLLKASCSYTRNRNAWNTILKNVSFDSQTRLIKFDVWAICQSIEGNNSPKNRSPNKIRTVTISSKLQMGNNTGASLASGDAAGYESPNPVDGGAEVILSEPSVNEE